MISFVALPLRRSLPWLGLIAAAAGGLLAWNPLIGAALIAAFGLAAAVFLRPGLGLGVALATLIAGQTVRLPLFGAESNVLPNDLLLPLVLFSWAVRQLVDRRPLFAHGPFNRLLLLFTGFLALSLTVAWLSGDFTGRELFVASLYLLRWIEHVLLFFVARSAAQRGGLRSWIRIFGLAVLLVAVLGFIQLLVLPDFSSFVPKGWDPHIGRLLSTWFDPNFLAGLFAFAILLFMALLHDRREDRAFSAIVAAVALLALVLTFSRSGYAGFVIGFGVLAVLRSRHFLAVGILAAFLVFLLVPRVQERVIGIRSVDETAQLRIVSYQNALTVLRDHPWFGVGYNTYRYVQVRYGFLDNPAEHSAGGSDSSVLTVAVTAGLLGLVSFLILLVKMVSYPLQVAFRARDPWLRTVSFGVVGGLIALIVHGQFVNGLFYPHLMIVIWMILGLVTGAWQREEAA